MRLAGEEPSCTSEQVIDLVSAVRELHGLSSQELNKLLRDPENFTTEKGLILKVDVEKLAGLLPLHLIAVLMSSDRDESFFRYMLCGIRLLHSLCDLAPRNPKLEQVLLDDVKVSEQILDLVFYLLILLGASEQDSHGSKTLPLVLSALVACSLHLLTACISSQWHDLVQVLLAHPKVDIFIDAAFGAVLVAISFLQAKLSALDTDFNPRTIQTEEHIINFLCQQCEASLQFLHSLCQQKVFREHVLRNKDLCGNGGILFLALAILKLNMSSLFVESSTVTTAVSRLKAKVLSLLLHLCEAESISYLDEIASSPRSFNLAKSIALEVLELLKAAVDKDAKASSAYSDRTLPSGLLQLNAMRLADIFSDDSNFRSYITTYFTKVLTAIFSLPHGDFLSIWCSSELPPREEDATLEYDTFTSAGWILDTFSKLDISNALDLEVSLVQTNMLQATYSHQRTSLFVKVIANLHCFVPNICEEQERNLFLHKFLECMRMDPSILLPGYTFTSHASKAVTVCRNLRSLLSHAESLIPNFLNEEDVQLLRLFSSQLEETINRDDFEEIQCQDVKFESSISWDKFSKLDINEQYQEAQSTRQYSSPIPKKELSNHTDGISGRKEEMSETSAIQDEDRLNLADEPIDQVDDVIKERKHKYGRSASVVMRDIDMEGQIPETSGSDSTLARGRNFGDQSVNGDLAKSTHQHEEKQPRKRKRTIMNDYQVALIEKALLDEPEMHRNAASLQSWADRLSLHGSEVTSSQIKNWLNNRKARLARAGKDARAAVEVDKAFPEKPAVPVSRRSHESPESLGEDNSSSSLRDAQSKSRIVPAEVAGVTLAQLASGSECGHCKPGQYVVLVDEVGEEIGRGKVHQMQGKWYGKSLEESGAYVVDITDLKIEKYARLPYPSEVTGSSFSEAEAKIGTMRVLWNPSKLCILRSENPYGRKLNS